VRPVTASPQASVVERWVDNAASPDDYMASHSHWRQREPVFQHISFICSCPVEGAPVRWYVTGVRRMTPPPVMSLSAPSVTVLESVRTHSGPRLGCRWRNVSTCRVWPL
jgi:hypothetical protein